MSDGQNKRAQAQVEREIAEADTVRARYQAMLDMQWQQKRAAEIEERRMKRQLDPYGLGLYD